MPSSRMRSTLAICSPRASHPHTTCDALTGAVEVDAADLEALPDFPDAVEHQAMPLIALGERALTTEILGDGERHFREPADRLRILIPEASQRVGERRPASYRSCAW